MTIYNLDETSSQYLILGRSNPIRIKNNSGVFEARDKADSAYIAFQALSGSFQSIATNGSTIDQGVVFLDTTTVQNTSGGSSIIQVSPTVKGSYGNADVYCFEAAWVYDPTYTGGGAGVGLKVKDPGAIHTSGSVSVYGIYIDDLTSGSTNRAILTGKGAVLFGDFTTINGWQDAVQLKVAGASTQTNDVSQVRDNSARVLLGTGLLASVLRGVGSATNTINNTITSYFKSTGTPAAGIGAGIVLGAQDSTTDDVQMSRWRASWSTIAHASRASQAWLSASDSTGERDIATLIADGSRGQLGVLAGTSTQYAKVGGAIFNSVAVTLNTAGTETDLATFTFPANTFATNNDSVEATFMANFSNSVNTKRFRVYIGGSSIVDITSAVSIAGNIGIRLTIQRIDSTHAAIIAMSMITATASTWTPVLSSNNSLTLTFSGTLILKYTGLTTNANEIANRLAKVIYLPAA